MSENNIDNICYMCRRTEDKAGKMIHLPGNMVICGDCLQRTINALSNSPMAGYFQNGNFNPEDMMAGMNAIFGMNGEQNGTGDKKETGEIVSDKEQEKDETLTEADQNDDKEKENRKQYSDFQLRFYAGFIPKSDFHQKEGEEKGS